MKLTYISFSSHHLLPVEKLYSCLKEIPLIVKLKNFDLVKQSTRYVDSITSGVLLVVAPAASKESLHSLIDKTITHVASQVDSTVDATIIQLLVSLKSLKVATRGHGISLYNACDANKAFVDAIGLAKEKLPIGVTSRLESIHNYALDAYTSSMCKAIETKDSIVNKATEAAKTGYDNSLPYAIKVLDNAQPYVVQAVNLVSPVISSAAPLIKRTYTFVEPVVETTKTYMSENKVVGPYFDKSMIIASEVVDRTVEYCTENTVVAAQSVSTGLQEVVRIEDAREATKTPTSILVRGQVQGVDDWPPEGILNDVGIVVEELPNQDTLDEMDEELSLISH